MITSKKNKLQAGEAFRIEYNHTTLTVYEKFIGGQVLFAVVFPGVATPLVLTRATRDNKEKFWTSIPEGRQREAEAIGPLIASHLKHLQQQNNVLL